MSSGGPANLETSFSQRLISERERLGLSQEGLARLAGVSLRVLAGYELGRSAFKENVLLKLSHVGVDLPYLIDGERSDSFDPALFDRIKEWADDALFDPRGNPVPEWERLQRMVRAYRWTSATEKKKEREQRLSALPRWKAA